MDKSENIFSEKEMPAINKRVKSVIEYYSGGSVKLFSEQIKLSNSQKLNRIFNIDKRNGEYPIVSSDILIAIANMFSDIDINWILTGNGEMHKTHSPKLDSVSTNSSIYMIDKIEKQSKEIGRLEKEIEVLQDRMQKLQTDVSNSKEEDVSNVKNVIAV